MIKNNIAKRKMFRGGGMAMSGPSGIMASSPSLIEAISRDAMNPMGGATLSMNQGGRVSRKKFQEGGITGDRFAIHPNSPILRNIFKKGEPTEFKGPEGPPLPPQLGGPRIMSLREQGDMDSTVRESQLRPLPQPLVSERFSLPQKIDVPRLVNNAFDISVNRAMEGLKRAIKEGNVDSYMEMVEEKNPRIAAALIENMPTAPEQPESLVGNVSVPPAITIQDPIKRRLAEALAKRKEISRKTEKGEDITTPAKNAVIEWFRAINQPIDQLSAENLRNFARNHPQYEDYANQLIASLKADPEIRVPEEEQLGIQDVEDDFSREPGHSFLEDDFSREPGHSFLTEKERKKTEAAALASNMEGKVAVNNSTDPKKPPVITDRPILFNALKKKGPEIDPDAKNAAIDDVIGRLAEGTVSGNIDIATLKKDIESLLPAVEDDSQMEGLLLAQLGAAIAAGKDSNAWTNIGVGLEKALPTLMNYKDKQTSAKRQRQMSIAKMALTQKFALESEQRAEARAIRTGVRAEKRDIRKEGRVAAQKLLEIGDYTTLKAHTVPANLFKKGEKGEVTIPAFTSLPLDSYGRKRMAAWGIDVVPVGKYAPKAADQIAAGTVVPMDELSLKELNRLWLDPKMSPIVPWEEFGSNYRPTYRDPKGAGMERYGLKRRMEANDYLALHKEYERVRGGYGKLYQSLSSLSELDPKKLVGTGSIPQQIGTTLKGLAGYSDNEKNILNQWANTLLGGKDLSDVNKFETRGRILLARMAPIILGESGKTISDADRIRVARSLGFEVDVIKVDGKDTFGGITGVNSNIFKNPESISAAIQQTATIISDSLENMHSIYQRETQGIGVVIPDLEMKQQLSSIKGRQPAPVRLKFNLTRQVH